MVLSYPALAGEGVMDRGQRAKARRYRISITLLPTLDVPFFFFGMIAFLKGPPKIVNQVETQLLPKSIELGLKNSLKTFKIYIVLS